MKSLFSTLKALDRGLVTANSSLIALARTEKSLASNLKALARGLVTAASNSVAMASTMKSLASAMKKLALLTLLALSSQLQAQILGLVLDTARNPIAGVQLFERSGHAMGISGPDGYFRLQLRPGAYQVVFSHSEYYETELPLLVRAEKSDTLLVLMEPKSEAMEAVTISTKWKDPGPLMMQKAIARREIWAGRIPPFSAELYIKAFEYFDNGRNTETQAKIDSGELPTWKQALNAAKADSAAQADSSSNAERIAGSMVEKRLHLDWAPGNRIKESVSGYRQRGSRFGLFYLSSTEADFNPYQNLMEVPRLCPLPLMSPLSNNALLAYRFHFVGAYTDQQGQRILRIKMNTRQTANSTFNGELHIVDTAFYIKEAHYSIPSHLLGNYSSMDIDLYYRLDADSNLLLDSQRFVYSTKVAGGAFKGQTAVDYRKVEAPVQFDRKHFGLELSRTEQEAYDKDSSWWVQERSQPLSNLESLFLTQEDSLERLRNSDAYLDSIEDGINRVTWQSLLLWGQDHKDRRKGLEWSLNPLAFVYQPWWPGGSRLELYGSVKKTFDDKTDLRFGLNGGYGFQNQDLRGTAYMSRLYNPYKRASYFVNVGRDFGLINPNAAYIDFFRRDNFYVHNHITAYHNQELINGLFLRVQAEFSDRQDIASYQFDAYGDSLFENNKPISFAPHSALFADINLSYTPFQHYLSEPKQKVILGSRWPTFSVNYRRAIPGPFGASIDYTYLEYRIEQDISFGLMGFSELRVNSGSFLQHRNINLIDYRYQRRGDEGFFTPPMYNFQTLDSTFTTFKRFVELHYRHQFEGALINHIPFVKNLNMSESVGLNMLYAPERRDMFFYEAYAGIDKRIRIWRQHFKLGLYYAVGMSNIFEQPRMGFKINFQSYDRYNGNW